MELQSWRDWQWFDRSRSRRGDWHVGRLHCKRLIMRYRPGRKHHVDTLSRDVATLSSVQGQVEESDKIKPLDESQAVVFDNLNSGGGVTVTVQQVSLSG